MCGDQRGRSGGERCESHLIPPEVWALALQGSDDGGFPYFSSAVVWVAVLRRQKLGGPRGRENPEKEFLVLPRLQTD